MVSKKREALIQEFIESYRQTTHELIGVVREGMKDFDELHPGMFAILKSLSRSGATSQSNIAAELNHSDAAISRQIALLRERGFVTTDADANNRRKQVVSLTQKGHDVLKQAEHAINKKLSKVLAKVPDELLGRLIETNQHLRKGLNERD